MRVVIPGGNGLIGRALASYFLEQGHDVVILSRHPNPSIIALAAQVVEWDGSTVGSWAEKLDGADLVINLAGKSVNCRYTDANMREIKSSRVNSVRALGQAIARAKNPPATWLQAATATIYAHRFDAPNDEKQGRIDDAVDPPKWAASVDVAKAWERELDAAETPNTRKVAMRISIVMSPDKGGAFDIMCTLARRGLLGPAGDGRQFVSWIHVQDLCRAMQFIAENRQIEGPVNVTSPNPLPNREFNRVIRNAVHAKFALPSPAWLLEIGASFMNTETELILKSRYVVPGKLLEAGFKFDYPTWPAAAADLVRQRSN